MKKWRGLRQEINFKQYFTYFRVNPGKTPQIPLLRNSVFTINIHKYNVSLKCSLIAAHIHGVNSNSFCFYGNTAAPHNHITQYHDDWGLYVSRTHEPQGLHGTGWCDGGGERCACKNIFTVHPSPTRHASKNNSNYKYTCYVPCLNFLWDGTPMILNNVQAKQYTVMHCVIWRHLIYW